MALPSLSCSPALVPAQVSNYNQYKFLQQKFQKAYKQDFQKTLKLDQEGSRQSSPVGSKVGMRTTSHFKRESKNARKLNQVRGSVNKSAKNSPAPRDKDPHLQTMATTFAEYSHQQAQYWGMFE